MFSSVRKNTFNELAAFIGPLGASARHAVVSEAFAWAVSVAPGDLHGIPVWTYSNGIVLFATDRPEAHARERLAAYLEAVELAKALWGRFSADLVEDPAKLAILASDPCVLEADSEYGSWRDAHLAEISRAKAVLEASEETEAAFIVCRKCKSNSVDTEQKQTRSADEPMTIFCKCRKCASRWTLR